MSFRKRIALSTFGVLCLTLVLTGSQRTSDAALLDALSHTVTTGEIIIDDACCGGERCVTYVERRAARKSCCDCCCVQKVETVIEVQDPRRCCTVAIPVCVPACCEGCPEVDSRKALFGRGVATATWCCGHKVRVVIDKCGDITVHQ